jgi:hypothetical protein
MLECSLILKVGQVQGEELIAVRVGVLPERDLKDRGKNFLLFMRGLGSLDNHEHAKYVFMGSPRRIQRKVIHGLIYGQSVNFISKTRAVVIYGHDARRVSHPIFRWLIAGLSKYAKGIDNNCVRGRKLTILIYPGEQIVRVKCKEYYNTTSDKKRDSQKDEINRVRKHP